jgi:phosphoserine phosphatase
MLSFAGLKFFNVVYRVNPEISIFYEHEKHQTKDEALNLNDINFHSAVVISDSSTG